MRGGCSAGGVVKADDADRPLPARSRSSENAIEGLFCSDSGQRQRLDQRLRAFELNDL